MMDDSERFKGCAKLICKCASCQQEQVFGGSLTDSNTSGLNCTACGAMNMGRSGPAGCYTYLSNRVTLLVRDCVRKYYDCWLSCDDSSCKRHTMQQSVVGYACSEDCHGRMVQDYNDLDLHTQLKYIESLFDLTRACEKRAEASLDPKVANDPFLKELERDKECDRIRDRIPVSDRELYRLLHLHMQNTVRGSGYNWVRPSLWSAVFGKVLKVGV